MSYDDLKQALREHLRTIGRKGGASTSPAKRAAAAKNGQLGGRPKVFKSKYPATLSSGRR